MEQLSRFRKVIIPDKVFVLSALIVATAIKAWLVLVDVLPFNSDEAVVALMASHILSGAKPIFFYGQAYMGSLDAYLVALGFLIFSQQVWVIRFVQAALYLGVLLSTYKLGELSLGSKRAGVLAVWLLAIPNVIVTLYTTVSLGGYVEGLLLGNFIFILGLQISNALKRNERVGIWRWSLLGFLAGFGLWVIGITLIYTIPMGVFIAIRFWQQNGKRPRYLKESATWYAVGCTLMGGFLGALPWWLFAIQNGFTQLLSELMGSAVAVEGTPWLLRSLQHLVNFVLFGGTAAFGMRPSWEFRWLALPLMPLALAFWVGVLVFTGIRLKPGTQNRFGAGVLVGMMLVLAGGFVFTSFGVDLSGRYFVPLAIPLSLFAGEMILTLSKRYGQWIWGLFVLILTYNFWGIVQSAGRYPPGITTQFNKITQVDQRYLAEVAQFLESKGELRGYTNYWVSYPLAFKTQEELIFIPRLPYHEDMRYTSRDDRYEPYTMTVENADKVAYITTNHPALNARLRSEFNKIGANWEETQIGEFTIFYNLSFAVRPRDIGLGLANQ